MIRVPCLVLLLAVCLLPVSTASAETLLANFAYTGTSHYLLPSVPMEFRPFVSYGHPANQPAPGHLDKATMTLLDVVQGKGYDLNGDFANFASMASNGVDNVLYLGFVVYSGTDSWTILSESTLLAGAFFSAPGVGSPDFSGYELTRVHVLGTSFSSSPDDEVELTLEFSVYGNRTVPEPSSLIMLTLGIVALAVCRTIRQR